jgi:hypothetical protein
VNALMGEDGERMRAGWGLLLEQLRRIGDPYRTVGNKFAPNPVVVPDHVSRIKMRPVVQRVSIAGNDHIVVV